MRNDQGTTRTVSGLHATVYAVANLIRAMVLPNLILRLGRNAMLRFGVIGMCLGLAVYTGPGGLGAPLTGIAIVSFSSCAIVEMSNAFLLDYQKAAGPAALTQANALAALIGLLAPLSIGIGAATILAWRFGLWMLIGGLIISEVLRRRYSDTYRVPTLVHDLEVHHGPLPRAFYWSIGSLACFCAAEFALFLWSADLLRDRGDLGPAAAATSATAITVGVLVGRAVGSRIAESVPSIGYSKVRF